jgi:hypothetical protein
LNCVLSVRQPRYALRVSDKPIAIRVVRPQETEEAWFEQELGTMTRSSLLLLGVGTRPAGTVLRFEVTLKSGKPVLRGEGKVVEMRAFEGTEGLLVRFTKLDPKSKQTVDAAHTKRGLEFRARTQSFTNEAEPLSEAQPAPLSVAQPEPVPAAAPMPVPAAAELPAATPDSVPAPPPRPTSQPPIPLPEPFPESPRQIISAKRISEAPTREIPIVRVAPPEAHNVFEALRQHVSSLTAERVREILDEGAAIQRAR